MQSFRSAALPILVVLLGVSGCKSCRRPQPLGRVERVSGVVEIQRAGEQAWSPAAPATALFAGDRVKTSALAALAVTDSQGNTLELLGTGTLGLSPAPSLQQLRLELLGGDLEVVAHKTSSVVVSSPLPLDLVITGSASSALLTLDGARPDGLRITARNGLRVAAGADSLDLAPGEVAVLSATGLSRVGGARGDFEQYESEAHIDALVRPWAGARIGVVTGDLRIRRAGSREWIAAREGMVVAPEDEIEAPGDARATLRYADGVEVEIQPGAAVVLGQSRQDASGVRKAAMLFVRSGEVISRVAGAASNVVLRILTPMGLVRSAGGKGDQELSVRAGDAGVNVEARIGVVEIVSRAGRRLVGAGMRFTIDATGDIKREGSVVRPAQPSTERTLAVTTDIGAPVLVGEVRRHYDMNVGQVQLDWRPVERAAAYDIELAYDPSFSRSLLERRLRETSFVYQNQREATVFCRVRAVDARGREGPYSVAHRLDFATGGRRPDGAFFGGGVASSGDAGGARTAEGNTAALDLRVASPANNSVFSAANVEVRGHVSPGNRILVNNREVNVSATGEYSTSITIEPGVNQVVVEARSPDGRMALVTRNIVLKTP